MLDSPAHQIQAITPIGIRNANASSSLRELNHFAIAYTVSYAVELHRLQALVDEPPLSSGIPLSSVLNGHLHASSVNGEDSASAQILGSFLPAPRPRRHEVRLDTEQRHDHCACTSSTFVHQPYASLAFAQSVLSYDPLASPCNARKIAVHSLVAHHHEGPKHHTYSGSNLEKKWIFQKILLGVSMNPIKDSNCCYQTPIN